jgi:hypothetical protein
MVPGRGLEPPRLSALASKTSVSAISPPGRHVLDVIGKTIPLSVKIEAQSLF